MYIHAYACADVHVGLVKCAHPTNGAGPIDDRHAYQVEQRFLFARVGTEYRVHGQWCQVWRSQGSNYRLDAEITNAGLCGREQRDSSAS